MQLASFRSHKIVRAGRIVWIDPHSPARYVDVEQADGTVVRHEADAKLFARGMAALGDYLVQYDDGYVSWSPKNAFEDGYTRIEG